MPAAPPTPSSVITSAISRGVPAFNSGDHAACVDIYTAACRALARDPSLPSLATAALESALRRAAETGRSASQRAWALREGLDGTLVILRTAEDGGGENGGERDGVGDGDRDGGGQVQEELVLQSQGQSQGRGERAGESVQAANRLSPKAIIKAALKHGSPAFNSGDHAGCGDVYVAACRVLLQRDLPSPAAGALEAALFRADEAGGGPTRRAWALREGLDDALDILRAGCVGAREPGGVDYSTSLPDGGSVLFDFSHRDARWRVTDDVVMGGASQGSVYFDDGTMVFSGELSLANNGGFSSVRSPSADLGLEAGDFISARVRGDGREFALNLYTPERRRAFSYRAKFTTVPNEWMEVRVPVEEFLATSFGKTVAGTIDAKRVCGVGFLLGDKAEGSFRLEVEWIRAGKAQS